MVWQAAAVLFVGGFWGEPGAKYIYIECLYFEMVTQGVLALILILKQESQFIIGEFRYRLVCNEIFFEDGSIDIMFKCKNRFEHKKLLYKVCGWLKMD